MVISNIKVDESLKYSIVIGRILDWAEYGIACSLTTVLPRTPITQMIFFNQGMLLLGSNHFLTKHNITEIFFSTFTYC